MLKTIQDENVLSTMHRMISSFFRTNLATMNSGMQPERVH